MPQALVDTGLGPLSLEESNEKIAKLIRLGKGALVSRIGGSEIRAVLDVIRMSEWKRRDRLFWRILTGETSGWNPIRFRHLALRGGFYPWDNQEKIVRFAQAQREAAQHIDLLGSWVAGENMITELDRNNLGVTKLAFLEPFSSRNPWTAALEGRKVLVIHPFAKSIESQYLKRELLFDNSQLLPNFDLQTLEAVQSLHDPGVPFPGPYSDWFAALDCMWEEIVKKDYDVAIIGAGAYGLPLGARIKKSGKVAIHLGGATQLLFGIWGGRWDSFPEMVKMRNEHWVAPLPSETPPASRLVAERRYW